MRAVRRVRSRWADSRLEVIAVNPVADPRWLQLLHTRASGLFHSPPWVRAVTETYGFEPRAYLVVDGSGSPRGGLAFCIIPDAYGSRVVSFPFSDACDPLLAAPQAWPVLFNRLADHGVPIHMRCLKEPAVPGGTPLRVSKRARWHTLEVAEDPGVLWRGIHPSARRAIRRAESSGVVVRPLVEPDAISMFRDLHVRLRKHKYRLLAQPAAFFRAIARRFSEVDGWFPLGAFAGDRLIAATIYLRWRDTLYYKFNASALDALNLRPNNLLVWSGIELARSLGCRALDLGPSDDDQPGLIRFKRQFGAVERELRFLHYAPSGGHDDRAADLRASLSVITRRLTAPEVPDAIAGCAGDLLYRLFA